MSLIKESIFGVLIPSNVYPTEILKIKSLISEIPNSFATTWIANQALTYSSRASTTLNSVDHSTLYPSSSTLIQGLGTHAANSSPSIIWTVFNSINLAPAK